jgi:O-antigen/teichoic acid export membrane protein
MSRFLSAYRQIEGALGVDIMRMARWQYFLNIGLGIVGALYMLVLGRLLGAAEFGFYTLCVAVPTVVFSLSDARLQECILYLHANAGSKAEFRTQAVAIYAFDVAVRLVALVTSILFGFIIVRLGYAKVDAHLVLLATLTVVTTKLVSTPSMGVLRANGEMSFFSIMQVADWAMRLVSLVALYAIGALSLQNVLITQIVIGGIFNVFVILRALCILELDSVSQVITDARNIVPVLRANRSLVFGSQAISAMDSVVRELDVLICGLFLSVAQVGVYKMAKSLAGIVWRLADPVYIIVLPRLAALHAAKDHDRLAHLTRLLTLGLAGFSLILYLVSVVGVDVIGPRLVGPEYAQAIALYPLAAAWIVVALPLLWTHSMAIAAGRPVIQMWGGLLGNGIGLLALFAGAYSFGLTGAAIGLSLAYCLPFVFSFVLLRRAGVVGW